MKEKIKNITEQIKEIENNFDWSMISTAFYLYGRHGKEAIENLSEEDLQEIYEAIIDQNTLFNEDLNDYIESNFEV